MAGHSEEFPRQPPCRLRMVASWLWVAARGSRRWVRTGGASAGLHERAERIFVAGVSAGRRPPVGCAPWRVGGCCSGVRLRVGLRWALGRGPPDVASPGVPTLLRCAGAVKGAAPA